MYRKVHQAQRVLEHHKGVCPRCALGNLCPRGDELLEAMQAEARRANLLVDACIAFGILFCALGVVYLLTR